VEGTKIHVAESQLVAPVNATINADGIRFPRRGHVWYSRLGDAYKAEKFLSRNSRYILKNGSAKQYLKYKSASY